MAAANDLFRFVMELAGIAGAAYWGFNTSADPVGRVLVALALVAALVLVWALIVAPRADNPISSTGRELIGTALLLLTALGLYVAGQRTIATVFAGLIIINTVLMLVLES